MEATNTWSMKSSSRVVMPDAALAARAPASGKSRRGPFDVPGVRNRDDDVLVRDEVLERDLDFLVDDLGAALVAVVLVELAEFPDDHALPGPSRSREFL